MRIFMSEKEREAYLNKAVLHYKNDYGNVKVTNREVEDLKGPHFLNDNIIDFYFLHITTTFLQSHESFLDDILLVQPIVSYLLQHDSEIKAFTDSHSVASKQVVIFPVNNNPDGGRNDGGSHWSLLVYYRKSNTFVHYDSLGTNGSSARKLFRAVKKFVATTADTIVDQDLGSTDTSAINTNIVGSDNNTIINIGDVDSNNTSTHDISPVNGDGDSKMIDGDSNDTSMTDANVSSSSNRVDEDGRAHGHLTSVDSDENQLQQHNQKKLRMPKFWEEEDRPWAYRRPNFSEEEDMHWLYRRPNMREEEDMHRPHWSYGPRYARDPYMYSYHRRQPYSKWDRDHGFSSFLPRGYPYHVEDDSFKEERCMPKQENYYDCGLYVMETARVICEWYYLDEEAKQKQPEHDHLDCKLGGGGRFPNISEYVHTSLESKMRKTLLGIIQQLARESGIDLDLSSDDEHKDDDFVRSIFVENDSKDEEITLQFGPQPRPPQDYKSEDETFKDCCGVAALPLPLSISSTSKDEPQEIYHSASEDSCSLFNKSINYLEEDDFSKKKLA